MIRSWIPCALATVALLQPSRATAEARGGADDADALFAAAKQLRDAGQYAEACVKFGESNALTPGVGVSLYLADCYEHVGKLARAWTTFRAAEQRALERKDERAKLAAARARSLEAKLGHLRIALAPSLHRSGVEVWLDGDLLPPAPASAGVVLDPGDHVVALKLAGRVAELRNVTIVPGAGVISVALTEPPLSPSVLGGSPAPSPAPESAPAGRAGLELGLLTLGVVGVGAGAAFLVAKNQSLSDGAPSGAPASDPGASAASVAAFAVGGAAFASAILLYLSAPASKEVSVRFSPVPLAGGGGASLQASF